MSRRNKLVLVGILAILYIIIALNFHKIKFAIGMLNLYSVESKTESAEEKLNPSPPVENPLEIIIKTDDPVDKPSEPVDSEDKILEEESEKSPAPKLEEDKKSYLSIVSDYNNKLEALRSEFEGELSALMAQAIEDYSKGESSTLQLASQYLSSGTRLEKSSDSRFNQVVKDMEKELKANGHDTSIIKDIRAYYTSFKSAKKSDLLGRGMKRVR